MKLEFTVKGNPVGKERARVAVRGGFPHAYTPTKTKNYELEVWLSYKSAARQAGINIEMPFGKQSLILTVTAYYKLPKSTSQANRNKALNDEIRPVVKPDGDNVLKCIADALNGRAYKDDSQVVVHHCEKRYGEPRAEVTIEIWEPKYEDTGNRGTD